MTYNRVGDNLHISVITEIIFALKQHFSISLRSLFQFRIFEEATLLNPVSAKFFLNWIRERGYFHKFALDSRLEIVLLETTLFRAHGAVESGCRTDVTAQFSFCSFALRS